MPISGACSEHPNAQLICPMCLRAHDTPGTKAKRLAGLAKGREVLEKRRALLASQIQGAGYLGPITARVRERLVCVKCHAPVTGRYWISTTPIHGIIDPPIHLECGVAIKLPKRKRYRARRPPTGGADLPS